MRIAKFPGVSCACLCLLFALSGPVWAKNVALVIGNAEYEAVEQLANPVNDATAVAQALESQGFEVLTRTNLGRVEMRQVLRDFRTLADSAETALVYYAGHGIEIAGRNYLMPVDAVLLDERDASLEMVDADQVLRQISGATRLKMVVLDACRNNPFVSQMKRENTGRNVGRGLAIVENAGADTLIAYAAAAGEITPDGIEGGNSPFTAAFLDALGGPPTDVRRMLGTVRDRMRQTVPGAAPFVYTSLGGEEYVINPNNAVPEPEVVAVVPVAPQPDPISLDFVETDGAASVAAWDAFLVRYEPQNTHPLYAFALQRRFALQQSQEADRNATISAERDAEAAREREALQAAIAKLEQENADSRARRVSTGPGAVAVQEPADLPQDADAAARSVQTLLKQRGCYSGAIDGLLGRGSTAGMAQFLETVGSPLTAQRNPPFEDRLAYLDALRQNPGIRCPVRAPDPVVAAKPRAPAPVPAAPAPAQVEVAEQPWDGKIRTEADYYRRAKEIGLAPSNLVKCLRAWKSGGAQKYQGSCVGLYAN